MNPALKELIEMEPLRVEGNLSMVFGCGRSSSLMPNMTLLFPGQELKSDRLAVEVLAELRLDHRRSWVVVRLRFDGEIIAVAQRGGRELDDWVKLWVLGKAAYAQAIAHLNHLIIDSQVDTLPEMAEAEEIDIEWQEPDCSSLLEFYGKKLTLGEATLYPMF